MNIENRPRRKGLTTLEFVGCIVAVVGGAYLGALYLGVDVEKAAYTALNESQLLEKVPEQWRPEGPKEKTMTREQLVSTLREELGTLRTELTALRTGKSVEGGENSSSESTDPAIANLPTKERTLAYWTRLNEIALGEAALQEDAETAFNAANAAKVFAIKGRVSRFAAKSVEAIPTLGVDETAVRFGRELGLWYNHGGELYEKAMRIWETPIGPQARVKMNEEWKQAELHYQNEAQLINDKAAAARGSISRIYSTEFPAFAKATKPAEKTDPAGDESK
jgi:hypothetical protein